MKEEKKAAQAEQPAQAETTAVAEAPKAGLPASIASNVADWGRNEMSSKDMVISRLIVMQPTSKLVASGDQGFVQGDMVDSLTNRKLGSYKAPTEIIPFDMRRNFIEYDVTAGEDIKNKKFLRVTPITAKNENLPYKDSEKSAEGKTIKVSRDYVLEFFCLSPEDVKNGSAVPFIISFRRSALKNGKKLATQMYVTNHAAKLIPPAQTVELFTSKETDGDNTWAMLNVNLDPGKMRRTSEEGLKSAFDWFKRIRSGEVKVDDSELVNPEADAAVPSGEDVGTGPAKF